MRAHDDSWSAVHPCCCCLFLFRDRALRFPASAFEVLGVTDVHHCFCSWGLQVCTTVIVPPVFSGLGSG